MSTELITAREASKYLGRQVRLKGHVYALRRMGAITFMLLRDRDGVLQAVIDETIAGAADLAPEQPLCVRGMIVNSLSRSHAYELQVESLEPIGSASHALPVEIAKASRVDSLSLNALLEHRPLTLRSEKIRAIFKIQAELCRAFREFLQGEHFTEIHSPKIVATGTEGGANLFCLEYFGQRAYLAQSPQFYKQIMVGVFERVFEIAPVYRAEEHSTARHLNEYTSMDLEMGFIDDEKDLIDLETRLLRHMFNHLESACQEELGFHNASLPELTAIPQISHADALEVLRRQCNWNQSEADLNPEAERLLCEYFGRREGIDMVFVTGYPWNLRPFYAKQQGELSCSFDLLFRGLEITTGGQRIHEYEELSRAMTCRGLEPEQFADYLQCFKYCMPPHGGLAIGLERLTAQILGLRNIREATLFPRDRQRLSP